MGRRRYAIDRGIDAEKYLVALAEDVELEANSRIIAPGKIIDVHGRNVVRTGDRLMELRREFVVKRNVARAIVNGDTAKVPGQMMNITGQAIRLKKGARVGVLKETDEYVAKLGSGIERKWSQRREEQAPSAAEAGSASLVGDRRRRKISSECSSGTNRRLAATTDVALKICFGNSTTHSRPVRTT